MASACPAPPPLPHPLYKPTAAKSKIPKPVHQSLDHHFILSLYIDIHVYVYIYSKFYLLLSLVFYSYISVPQPYNVSTHRTVSKSEVCNCYSCIPLHHHQHGICFYNQPLGGSTCLQACCEAQNRDSTPNGKGIGWRNADNGTRLFFINALMCTRSLLIHKLPPF